MKYTNDNVKKICNFYMSDWHFTVMLLPYISTEINKGTKVITIFEKDLTEKVETLVEKLNLKNRDKILKINWKNSDINSSMKELQCKLKKDKENILIINGSNSYISEANNKVNLLLESEKNIERKIKIIDCYDFENNKDNMNNILKKYDEILNTSGNKKINNIM